MEQQTAPFIKEENSFCILFVSNSYRQADLYSRVIEGKPLPHLYAKYGAGFYPIYRNGTTSSQKVKCKGINCNGVVWKQDKFGVLEVVENETK